MSRREVHDCDRCDRKDPPNIQVVAVQQSRDRGEMDTFGKRLFDLCPACMAVVLAKLLEYKTERECCETIGGQLAKHVA